MTDSRLATLLALALAPMAIVSGCSNGIESAACTACDGRTFSEFDCQRFAEAAGCASSMVGEPTGGCSGRCVFSACEDVPICTGLVFRDAGPADAAPPDAPVDPRCVGEDGLFATCDLCPAACSLVMVDGATLFTCDCGSCPCGFICGSISLPRGGTLGSVCAPAPL